MRLEVACHSPTEYSVSAETSGLSDITRKQDRLLYLFACFALRVLSNNVGHMVGDALAGQLDIGPFDVGAFPPSGYLLLSRKLRYELLKRGLKVAEAESISSGAESRAVHDGQFSARVDHLDRVYLANVPRLEVRIRSASAQKSFLLTTSPFSFRMRGFGLFGDGRYHAFMATLALAPAMASMTKNRAAFKERLSIVASACARAHFEDAIKTSQDRLAFSIISELPGAR